jgi:hypothetical protein
VTHQALRWLQLLLRERCAAGLQLEQTGQSLIISHPGIPGQIVFDTMEPGFKSPGFDPTCPVWDPSPEGWVAPLGKPLPAPGLRPSSEPVIARLGDGYRVHYDIPGLAYWALNRLEELHASELDAHGRFKSSSAHAVRHDYLERPVVDEWFDILRQVMRRLWPSVQLTRLEFTTWVSHDVDRPSRYGFTTVAGLLTRMGGDLLRRRQITDCLRAPLIRHSTRDRLHPDDPWNTFLWLMDTAERQGLRSAFFFICGRTDRRLDADYEVEHPAMQHLIRQIHLRGHAIGLHPSYHSYLNEDVVKREAQRLMSVCAANGVGLEGWGARMHYLRWSHPRTLQVLEAAGAAYDSSMTYPDRCGFRCGSCHDFTAFLPVEDRVLNIRIRPLVVMESSIIDWMGLALEHEAYAKFMEMKAACRAVGGVFSLLWHNSSLESARAKDLYERVVSS